MCLMSQLLRFAWPGCWRLGAGIAMVLITSMLGLAVRAEVTAMPLTRDPARPQGDQVGALIYAGGLWLNDDRDGFGGFSGLDVSPDGSTLTALSDRSQLLTGTLVYDAAGRLTGLTRTTLAPLRDTNGRPPRGLQNGDSEDIARLPDGGWLVVFERRHRLLRYPGRPAASIPVPLAIPPAMGRLPDNRGVEALAVRPGGRILMIAETRIADDVPRHQAWLGVSGGWLALTYHAAPDHRPTAAASLPSGDLVVLERRDPSLFHLASRLVRVPAAQIRGGAVLEGTELATIEAPLPIDNFEGIAAWRDAAGRTRLLIISDDNFSPLQRTLLLQFVLPGG